MALPTANISWSAIQTEFGGSNPVGLSEYYGCNANVAASGQIRAASFLGISNFAASTPDWGLSKTTFSPTNASVVAHLYANGVYEGFEGGTSVMSGTWKTGGGTGADYECRFTKMTGDDPTSGDATNTWHVLSSSRSWTLTETTDGFSSKTCSGHLEIRVTSGATLDNSTFSMTASVEV